MTQTLFLTASCGVHNVAARGWWLGLFDSPPDACPFRRGAYSILSRKAANARRLADRDGRFPELGRIVAGSFAIEIVGQFLEFCADEVL